jgi:uncharacterized protein YkwD
MIKKNLRTILLGVVTLLLSYLYFLSAHTLEPLKPTIKNLQIDNQKEEKEALNYLNQLRQGAGLIPLSSAEILNKASKNHANYLIENHAYGHYEEHNRSNFTGKFASDRVVYEGYHTGLIIENVSSNNRSYKESIDGLFAAIYHRFAFLDFQGDEIGIGINQNRFNRKETAFVYNIGSSTLNQLYKKSKKPSEKALNKALHSYKNINSKIVTYPFDKQTDVPPVFFNEMPDPLPDHDVSGFPISIAFNQAHFKKIKLLKFELFKDGKTLIPNTLTYDNKTDPNRRLDKLSFVLFPLERLEWNQNYSVVFLAVVDKQLIEKKWSFKTRNPSIPLHKIEDESKTTTITVNEPNLFYFPPKNPKDLLHHIRCNPYFDMEFIDKNTLKITALKTSFVISHIQLGEHKLKLKIQNP